MPVYLVYFDITYEIPYGKRLFSSKEKAINYFLDKYYDYCVESNTESISYNLAEKYPEKDDSEIDEIAYRQAVKQAQEKISIIQARLKDPNYNFMYHDWDDMPVLCEAEQFGCVQKMEVE